MGEQVHATGVALLIAGCSYGAIAAVGVPQVVDKWQADSIQRTLVDGSVLTEYYGFTTAVDRDNVLLRVGFVPRFDCSPLVGVEIHQDLSLADGPEVVPLPGKELLVDGDRLTLSIDRLPIEFPILADGDDKQTQLWFNSGLEDREALHSKFDLGNVAELALTSETNVVFSLLGSKSILDAAQSLCHAHDPLPYEKPNNR